MMVPPLQQQQQHRMLHDQDDDDSDGERGGGGDQQEVIEVQILPQVSWNGNVTPTVYVLSLWPTFEQTVYLTISNGGRR